MTTQVLDSTRTLLSSLDPLLLNANELTLDVSGDFGVVLVLGLWQVLVVLACFQLEKIYFVLGHDP